MPNILSKFHLHILPTFEKVTRWYEGLSSESDSDPDEHLTLQNFAFYQIKDDKLSAYKK